MITTVILTENVLTEHDVERLAHLHDPEPVRLHVLVPVDVRQNRFVEVIDDVALGRLAEALHGGDEPTHEERLTEAQTALEASVAALAAVGVSAEGSVVEHDPVAAAVDAATRLDADEVIVIAEPHPVEDTLHQDWSSKIRDQLDRPVLHVVAGTDWVLG